MNGSAFSYVPFLQAVSDCTGGNTKVQRKDYATEGELPVIDQGQEFIAGFTEKNNQYQGALPLILFGDHTRIFKYVDFPFALGADGVKALQPQSGFDARFLYYYFRFVELPNAGYSRHFKFLKEIQVPKPSLTEQRRIVELLSRADGIVRLRREAEKKAAELIPALFLDMFGDPATNPKGWPMAFLPDVLSRPFKNGLYLPKDRYAPEGTRDGVEMVHMSDAFYGEVKRGLLRRVLPDAKQISDYGLTNEDLLVARRSLNFDGAAKVCGIPCSEEPLLFESSFIRLTPRLDTVRTAFLLNYLNSDSARKAYVLSRISGITISGINQAALNQIPVFVPSLHIQNDFVRKVEEVRSIQSQQSIATAKAQATFDALLASAFA